MIPHSQSAMGTTTRLALSKSPDFWERERSVRVIRLFQKAAAQVPAYQDFLRKHKIDPAKIRSLSDLTHVPPVTKKNYIREYQLQKLVWPDVNQRDFKVISSTSGSTGEPSYFPRTEAADWMGSLVHETFLRQGSEGKRDPVLVIMGFSMGVWIAGLYTYKSFELAAKRGQYNLSMITPGINKTEILNALRRLGGQYSQVILTGYPPFLKDILDEAAAAGVNLPKSTRLRFLFAAEPFTEGFRTHLAEKGELKNLHLDTMNIYGTSELGAMAFETPLSILIRRAIVTEHWNSKFFSGAPKLPTLAQYNPQLMHFEESEGSLFISGDSCIPLIRYGIGDRGGVMSYREAGEKMKDLGWNQEQAIRESGIAPHIAKLPFVYVYERDDFSTTLYGLQIYPEVVREALLKKSLSALTGKFTMLTKFDKHQNQFLELNLEVKKGKKIEPEAEAKIFQEIFDHLREKNSEFRELSNHIKERSHPKLVFWPAEHPQYFKPGVKQKWVTK